MAITSLCRALLIVGFMACLAASVGGHGAFYHGPNPQPLDQNYNIPYKPSDYYEQASDKGREKAAPQITHLPSKREGDFDFYTYGGGHKRGEHNSCGCSAGRKHSPPTKRQGDIKFYSCGGDHKREEHNSCGCSAGRKHSPPTKRRDTSMCGRDLGAQHAQPTNLPEPNSCGCSSGRQHKPPTKRQENNSSAIVPAAKPSHSPVPVEMYPTYPGSDIAVPASELEVLKQWAAEGKYTGCNSGMKDKLPKRDHLEMYPKHYPGSDGSPKRDHLEMYPTHPGSDLAVPASELEVLKQWAAEGKHPEITANMNKHPLSKRLPPSFESFEELKKHREEIQKHKQQLSREQALQKDLESYENERIAAIADVEVKIQQTRVPDEDGDLPVVIKITITNNSKWKITYCDKTSPISSNAYKMGFFEVISRELRADIGAPANSTLAATQPSWEECSRDLYSGESASTWITFPPPDALDNPKLGSLNGGKYDVRLTGVWHGIQAMGDPEVDPKWDTNEWSSYTHRFSSNTITIEL